MSKILVLCPYVPHPPTHGGSIRTRGMLQALAADHAVAVAVATTGDDEGARAADLARELGVAVHRLPARKGRSSRLRKVACLLTGRSEVLGRRWTAAARAQVDALVATGAYDLVVLDSTYVLPLWRHRGRVVTSLHNLEHALFARDDGVPRTFGERWTRRLEARGIRTVERLAIRRSVRTVVVSDADRALAGALAPEAADRLAVIPNAVDLDRLPLQPPAPAGPVRLLFVGGLDYPPNLEAATELVEQHLPVLRRALPELVVRLVGRDPADARARWRGLAGVELAGPVDDLLPHYRSSHAAYLPIRSGGGTRIKILEAWALGLPVLSTDVGCEGLPAEDGVHLRRFVTPPQGLAALLAVLAGEGAVLRANARRLVEERYSHRAAIAQWRAVIASLLAR